MRWVLALTLCAVIVHAGENGVPPGLQKKGGVPPGLAKKQRQAEEEIEGKTNVVAVPAVPAPVNSGSGVHAPVPAAVPATPTAATPERSARAVKAEIDQRVEVVNRLDDRAPARRAALSAIAKETGASARALENQRREYPKIGTGGLLIANELAAQTKKPAGNFLKEHSEGKTWTRIAAEHHVKLDDIDAKLGRVEQAMQNPK